MQTIAPPPIGTTQEGLDDYLAAAAQTMGCPIDHPAIQVIRVAAQLMLDRHLAICTDYASAFALCTPFPARARADFSSQRSCPYPAGSMEAALMVASFDSALSERTRMSRIYGWIHPSFWRPRQVKQHRASA